jgi:hypothetical protein
MASLAQRDVFLPRHRHTDKLSFNLVTDTRRSSFDFVTNRERFLRKATNIPQNFLSTVQKIYIVFTF